MAPIGMDDQQRELVEQEALGMDFTSAEAYYAYQKARRLRLVIRYVGGILLLAGFGYAMFLLGGGRGRSGTEAAATERAGNGPNKLNIKPIGSPDAKLRITVVLPAGSDCHESIVRFITEVAQRHPDEMYADFHSMDSFTDKELSAKIGQVCAAVLVNGKTEFDHMKEGKLCHHISLIGTVPTHYSLGDLGVAINQEYQKAYGAEKGSPVDLSKFKPSCMLDSHGEGPHAHGGEAEDKLEESLDITLPGFLDMQEKPPSGKQ